MAFNHNFLTPIEIESVTTENGRFYILPNGEKVESVTTIIGKKTDKTALNKWRESVGEEKARQKSVQATQRGTIFHALSERFLLNEELNLKKEMPLDAMMFRSVIPELNRINNIKGLEFPLHSYELKTAGRSDCIADFDNVLSVIDFKTAEKKKLSRWITNYFIQGTCYAMMVEELYGIKIPQIVIIIAVEHQKPQVFIKKTEDYIDKVREMFK